MFCSCQRKIVRSFSEEIYYQKGEMPRSHTKGNGNSIKRIQKKKKGGMKLSDRLTLGGKNRITIIIIEQ